ncbi:MAG: hypothetical protein KC731_16935, partial [Myxococcales bacterium]|nr:hypothetical protein [Myxococcales bacterium]
MSRGKLIASGQFRVDAARAVEKLREHQLVDLHHYTHELARAAVASGAPRIDLDYDADDVHLVFAGEPLAPGSLERLLDHVLTPSEGDLASQRIRCLAMGVNAALGLDPAFVSLTATSAKGEAEQARWVGGLRGEAVTPKITQGVAPGAPGEVRFQLRRRLGFDVARRAITSGRPREIDSLIRATEGTATELWIRGERWDRERPTPLLTITLPPSAALGEGAAMRLEVQRDASTAPVVVFEELGVVLAREVLDLRPSLPVQPFQELFLPLSAVVTSRALPTNASRSAVREDGPFRVAVDEALAHGARRAVKALVASWRGEASEELGVTRDPEAQPLEIEEALGAFACLAGAAARLGDAQGELAAELLSLPLLADGCGEPLAVVDLPEDATRPIHLHRGEPLPAELAAHVQDVVLLRRRRVELVLTAYSCVDAAPLVARATEAVERRRAFLAHPPGEIAVVPSPQHFYVERFAVREGPFAGLEGEVALRHSDAARRRIRIFYEQRELGNESLDHRVLPLGMDIALAWDARLAVRFGFDGVEQDGSLRAAIGYAAMVGVRGASELSRRIAASGQPMTDLERAALVAAVLTAAVTMARLEVPGHLHQALAEDDPLYAAPVWRTTDPEVALSTREVRDLIRRQRGVAYAPADARGRAQNERPVLALTSEERDQLALLVGAGHMVPYGAGLGAPDEDWGSRRARALRAAVDGLLATLHEPPAVLSMPFSRPGVVGLIAVSGEARLVSLHAGVVLSHDRLARRYGAVVVAADDSTILPSPDWHGVTWSGQTWSPGSVERQLLVTVVAALAGDTDAARQLRSEVALDTLGARERAYLVTSLAAAYRDIEEASGSEREELERVVAQGWSLPLVTMLDDQGQPVARSLAEVLDAHGSHEPIPYLTEPPGFPTLDWRPLLVTHDGEAAALTTAFAQRLRLAVGQVPTRRSRWLAERRRREVLAREPVDVTQVPAGALPGVEPWTDSFQRGSIAIALAAGSPRFEVLHHGRPVYLHEGLPLPVVARISLDEQLDFEANMELSARGTERLRSEVVAAAGKLAGAVLEREGDGSPLLLAPLVALIAALVERDERIRELLSHALRGRTRWPTVQGGSARLTLARRGDEIFVGALQHLPWRSSKGREGSLDRPIIYTADDRFGDALRRLLDQLGLKVRDVSQAVAELQGRRSVGEEVEAPRLAGEPAHPALRVDLAELMPGVAGELELTAPGHGVVLVADLSAPRRPLEVAPTFPCRVTLHSESVASQARDERLLRDLERAGKRLLRRLLPRLDELPPFLRDLARRDLLAELVKAAPSQEQQAAPLFADTEGRWHSFAQLSQVDEPYWVTTSEPPYPRREDGRVILRLTEAEIEALRPHFRLRNMTATLERLREAEQRRAAAPVRSVLSNEERALCLTSFTLEGEAFQGEVGIVEPAQRSRAGITLLVEGRELCRIPDAGPWPILARVDQPGMRPNRYFDGPFYGAEADVIAERLAVITRERMQAWLAGPPDVAGSQWVEHRSPSSIAVGRLWLPRHPPAQPQVTVVSSHGREARALTRLFGPLGVDSRLPLEGVLLVASASELGFEIELEDEARLVVKAVPRFIKQEQALQVVLDLLAEKHPSFVDD